MKIIIATPLYPPEIAEPAQYVKELALRWSDKHKLTIITYANAAEKIPNVKIVAINKRWPLLLRFIKYTLSLLGEARGADIIYAQNAVAAGLPAIIVKTLLGIPVIIRFAEDEAWKRSIQLGLTTKSMEGFLETQKNNFKIRLIMFVQKFVLKHAQLIVAPSLYLSKIITAHYAPQEQILLNYNPAEKAEVLPFSENLTPHQIVAITKLFEWKKIASIIRSVALLKKEFSDIRLIIAGEGSEENNLKILAQELNVTNSITFLGQISRAEMWHLRKNSQICIISSSHEDVPDDAIKCFVTKTPVIAANAQSINEVIQNEHSGLLVKLDDDKDLANAIKRIFQNSDLRTRLVNEAQKNLEEKFSWSAHIRSLDNSLKSILSKK